MYKSVKSVRDCQELQQDLIQLQAWQERWQLRFNPKKCNVMRATHATRKKIEYPYTLDDTPLMDQSINQSDYSPFVTGLFPPLA